MPANVVKTAKDEKIWSMAKKRVAKSKDKSVSSLSGQDWGLVMNIFKAAKKKYGGRLPSGYQEGMTNNRWLTLGE